MKISVCTLTVGDEYKKTTMFGRLTKVKYCEKHGYDLHEEDEIYDASRPIPWSKIKLLQKHLPDYDYIVWLDGDTMIMNYEIKLEKFIKKYMKDGTDFMMTRDRGGLINTGVWFLKNTPFSNEILRTTWAQDQFINHRFWEQAAFTHLYNINHDALQDKCTVVPLELHMEFNADMYSYKKDGFLIHFLGIHNSEWLTKVMKDHFPFQKEFESDKLYKDRMQWLMKRYEKN